MPAKRFLGAITVILASKFAASQTRTVASESLVGLILVRTRAIFTDGLVAHSSVWPMETLDRVRLFCCH